MDGQRGAREAAEQGPEPEEPGELADEALAAIRTNPGVARAELAGLLELSPEELERPVAALLAAGHVRQEGEGAETRYFPS